MTSVKNFKNISVIGTSHISSQSVKEITCAVNTEQPEIIAIELDKRRYSSLMSNETRKISLRDVRVVGVKGFIFAVLGGWVQKKLGNIVKIDPGADMKHAAKLAKEKGIKLALIDQDITKTLKQFSKRITWKEKFRVIGDIFRVLIYREKEIKRLGLDNFDLTKVPSEKLIKKLMNELKQRYPNVYKVIVEDRNEVMASRLFGMTRADPEAKILAVVGAGHKEDILTLLTKKQAKLDQINDKYLKNKT